MQYTIKIVFSPPETQVQFSFQSQVSNWLYFKPLFIQFIVHCDCNTSILVELIVLGLSPDFLGKEELTVQVLEVLGFFIFVSRST